MTASATCGLIAALAVAASCFGQSEGTQEAIISKAGNLFKARQFPEAVKLLDGYTRLHAKAVDAPAAFLLKGKCEAQSKGAAATEAEKTWEWLIRAYPNTDEATQAYQELISFYATRSRPDMAERTRQRFLRQFPDHPAAVASLSAHAERLVEQGEYEKALGIYEKISGHLPPLERKRMALCQTVVYAGKNPEPLFTAAQETFLRNPADAEPLYHAFIKQAPNSANLPQARTRLGVCWSHSKDPKKAERAEELWQEVVARGPPADEWVMESRWLIIQLLAGPKKQWRDAIAELDAILRVAPSGSFRQEQALFTKAWLLWANKQWDDALKDFHLLVASYPAKAAHAPIQFYIKDCQEKKGSQPK